MIEFLLTGGSAIDLSATDALAEPLSVRTNCTMSATYRVFKTEPKNDQLCAAVRGTAENLRSSRHVKNH